MKSIHLYSVAAVRRFFLLTIVLSVVSSGVLIAQMFLLSKIVQAIFLMHAHLTQVMLLLLYFLGAILARAILIWSREITTQQAAVQVKTALRERLFAHLLQLGPIFSRSEHAGELTTMLNEGIERLDAYVSRYIPQIVLSIVIPLLIVSIVFPLDWISALLLLTTGPIIPLLMMLVGSYAQKYIQQQWESLGRMGAYLLDAMQGLTTLKLFGRSKAEQAHIVRISERFRTKTMQVLRYAFLSGAVLEFLTAMAIGVVAVVLGVRLIDHTITFEAAFLILLLTPEFYRPLQELGIQHHAGMEGKAAAQRITALLETPVPRYPSASRVDTVPDGQLTVQFTDVSCTYPDSTTPALRGVTLTLPAHRCTALVGRSGAGKSTLVNLLLRFMDYESGMISVNGVSLKDVPPELWRKYVALVPQHPYLFYGTVSENIRMAREDATYAEIQRAAQQAGACPFIEDLPQGFETLIGEQGLRLSAGQAQRLALARAFLKDAPLLIMDEPTSSLDAESEVFIEQAIEQLIAQRTVLIIAHRYNTIRHAHQVAVMQDGHIIECDTPERLLREHSAYAHLMQKASKEVAG